jgi:type IV pilus assembly protein PilM
MDSESIVFDFGRASTRILILEAAGKSVRVRDFATVPHGRHVSDEERKAALRPVLANLKTKSGIRAILTWEDGFIFRQLSLPDMPANDLEKAFLWEMKEKYLFKGEESFYTSEVAVETTNEDGSHEKVYNVFYSDRKSVSGKAALVESLGYRVSAVVPGQAAVAALIGGANIDTARDVLVFDIGAQSARILVVRDGRNILSRTVLLGGQTLTDMMTAAFFSAQGERVQLGPAEAEALKVTEGAQNPQAAHISLLRPYLEKVVSEIKRSIDYYEGQRYARPISKAVFTGGGSDLKGLSGYMGRFLGLEVAALVPENYASPSMSPQKKEGFAANFVSLVAGIGAGLDSTLNLLPRQQVSLSHQHARGVSVRLFIAATAILIGFWDVGTFLQLRLASSQLGALAAESRELNRISALVSDIESQQRFMRAALKGDLSHPSLLKALSRVTPASMTIDKIVFSREEGTLDIDGSVESPGHGEVKVIAQLITDILKTPFFKGATLTGTTPDEATHRLRFHVKCLTAGMI